MSLRPSSRPNRTRLLVVEETRVIATNERGTSHEPGDRTPLRRFPLEVNLRNPSCRHQSALSIATLGFVLSFAVLTMGWKCSVLLYPSPPRNQEGRLRVMTTNYGWDQQDKTKTTIGMNFGRSVRQAELWEGIRAHSAYWEDGWQFQSSRVAQKDHRYYVFLDVETCFESQYPHYVQNIAANSDLRNGRNPISSSGGLMPKLRSLCPIVDAVLATPLFRSGNNNTHLVLFDCRPFGPKSCLSRRDNSNLDHRVSLVSLSATNQELSPNLDIGLPPPAITKIQLTTAQEMMIIEGSCRNDDRPYLLSFVGSFRGPVRSQLKELDNGNDVIIMDNLDRLEKSNSLNDRNGSRGERYRQLLATSQFSAVPRGDNLYSYRFTEVLSAGAIPVIVADSWVLPLCSEILGGEGWKDLAVIIPESQISSTVDILRGISFEKKCEMRRRAYGLYQRYLSSPEAIVEGIIECLERRR
jgi:hypothetical protein